MTAAQAKMVRDVWQERGRTILMVLAIGLGIAAFLSVLSAYSILTRELNKGYMDSNPASATLRTVAIDDGLLKSVLANGAVSAAEARRVVRGQIQTGPMEWRRLVLFVVKDFSTMRIGKVQPEQGTWPPKAGELWIERDAFHVARRKVGEFAVIKVEGGKERRLRIAGSVHDVGQAQARMENIVYGYVTTATLAQLGEEPTLNELNIVVGRGGVDERHNREVAGQVKAQLEKLGHPVERVFVPVPGKHPHASIMGLLLLSMSAFGSGILLLSGVIVTNLLTALMAAQTREIGVMKATGATRSQIARMYFGEVALLGGVAVLVGLGPGLAGGRLLCRYMAGLLNFDMSSFAVPLWVYLLVLIAGVLIPLGAAAYPVLKGSGITVRRAIADVDVATDSFGMAALDGVIARTGGNVFRPCLMVLRNTLRRRERFLLTVMTLAASGVFFMSALNTRASLIRTLDDSFGTKRYDLWVTFDTLYPLAKLQEGTRGVHGITRAEGWIVEDGRSIAHGAGEPLVEKDLAVMGIPSQTTLLRLNMVSGRALEARDGDAMVVTESLATRWPAFQVGKSMELRIGATVLRERVVGIAREPFSGPTAYVMKRRLEEVRGKKDVANSLRIQLARTDAAAANQVKAALAENYERDGVHVLGAMTKSESRYGFDQHMLMIYVFLLITSGIICAVGGLGLMTSTTLNVMERRREIGMLRAIGATPRAVWLIVMGESVATGTVAWVVAALVAWPVSEAVGNGLTQALLKTRLDFQFEWAGFGVWLVVSLLVGVIASVSPARRASRVTVREALAWS